MIMPLLDESLRVQVFFEEPDCNYRDNICISFLEVCPQDEKLFIHDETNIFLTPEQAESFARVLLEAANTSREATRDKCGE
jgi:hypothetical protein